MDISSLLAQHVNQKFRPLDVLLHLTTEMQSCSIALFITHDQTTYSLLNCSCSHSDCKGQCTDQVEFEPKLTNNNMISNDGMNLNGFHCTDTIFNIMTIPISEYLCNLGCLCIYNTDDKFHETDIVWLAPVISLLKIMIQKEVFQCQLQSTYSDTNFMSKDLFLANMTHEIKTPLNGIVGYNQLLLETNLDVTQKSYMNNMSLCSTQLMKIINDMLDFSKLTSNRMKIENDCFSVSQLLQDLKHTISQGLKFKKQSLIFKIHENLPKYIISDKHKLLQILVNLINNASNFSSFESVIIVSVQNSPNTQNGLLFEVQDEGIGISSHEQCKLFNSFVQINNSITKTGSGLGLAISKKLVILLGGEICVVSEVGKGSSFKFDITYEKVSSYNKIIQRDSKFLKDKYVLLVDDSKENRIQIADLLFSWDMKPIICASALEALRMILSNRYSFQLALLDICMPGTSGIELANQIKEERPGFPLIALSSVENVVNDKFDYVLSKPVHDIQLFAAIHTIIYNNSSREAFIGKECNETETRSEHSSPRCSEVNHSVNILVAEDIPYNMALTIEMLKKLGYYNITSASDGLEVINILKKQDSHIDIILLDLRMPRVDGYGVLHYMKRNNIRIKVIAVTASNLTEDKEKCRKLDVNYFISKPIYMKTLKEVLLQVTKVKI
jgi:two-component system sensor histidine kinase/response regulator